MWFASVDVEGMGEILMVSDGTCVVDGTFEVELMAIMSPSKVFLMSAKESI